MLKECKLLERVSLLVTLYFEIRNTKNLFSNAMYRICLWMFLCLIWGAEFWYEYEYDINLHNFFQKSLYLHKNCRRNLFILNGFFYLYTVLTDSLLSTVWTGPHGVTSEDCLVCMSIGVSIVHVSMTLPWPCYPMWPRDLQSWLWR